MKRSRQLELPGTKKPRRGRPRMHPVGEGRHVKRPRITAREAVHVTLRTAEGVRYLRNRHTCEAVRRGLEVTYRRADIRICQLSVQHGHIHLIVEADGHEALARGMQSFQIACAKRLNRILTRRNGFKCEGRVFADRYHARVLRSPTETHHALRYVLSNFRKHGQGRGLVTDPYSTASAFDGWRRPVSGYVGGPLEDARTAQPRSWLLTTGWRCGGGLLDPNDSVGARLTRRA